MPTPRPESVRRSRRLILLLLPLALLACGGTPEMSGPPVARNASPSQAVSVLSAPGRYPAAWAACATASDVQAHQAGLASNGGAAVRPDSRFPVGSLTKSVTATLAGLMVQDGLLAWDTRLLSAVPELASTSQTVFAGVTLTDLLSHRSALPEFNEAMRLEELDGTLSQQRQEATARALAQPPTGAPGASVAYVNSGFIAAAVMLERAAATDYETLVQTRLFGPLGMAAAFGVAGEGGAADVFGHERAGGAWAPVAAAAARDAFPAALNPTGLMLSNAGDFGRYLQLHVRSHRGDAGSILRADTAAVLHTPVSGSVAALGWQWPNDARDTTLLVHNGTDGRSYMAQMAFSSARGKACAAGVNGHLGRTTAVDLRQAVAAMLDLGDA